MENEKELIIETVNKFAEEMKTKMLEKLKEGFSGWNNTNYQAAIRRSLARHINRLDNNSEFVDIANLCMMLHNKKKRID